MMVTKTKDLNKLIDERILDLQLLVDNAWFTDGYRREKQGELRGLLWVKRMVKDEVEYKKEEK